MNDALFQLASSSIAFNKEVTDIINREIAKNLDPRLFLFAHYSPAPIPKNSCAHACFYLAVVNMHNLIANDCGTMLQSVVLQGKGESLQIYQDKAALGLRKDFPAWPQFFWLVKNIRRDICHNNTQEYPGNKRSYFEHRLFLDSKPKLKDQHDWDALCRSFLAKCDDFAAACKNISKQSDGKSDKINLWLKAIKQYVIKDMNSCREALSTLFRQSKSYKYNHYAPAVHRRIQDSILDGWLQTISRKNLETLLKDDIHPMIDRLFQPQTAWEHSGPAFPYDVYNICFAEYGYIRQDLGFPPFQRLK